MVGIVAVTSDVTKPNLIMDVELAADWLFRNDLQLWLSTGTHGAGVCWGWDADFAVQTMGYDAQMTSAAENWDPVRAEPVAISVDGARVIFELPLAQLGDPEVLYFALITADRGPFSDVFPDTPGYPDEAPTCHEFAGLPDTAMTPTDVSRCPDAGRCNAPVARGRDSRVLQTTRATYQVSRQ